MAGYTRNDTTNQIADGNVINAAPLDGEFNAIESAFNVSTGHTHDGSTTGDGGPVSKLGPSQETVQSASTLATTTDITVATDKFIQFRDSGLKIQSSADGKLDIDADTELEMVAPTVDIDASTAVTIDTATMTVTGSANVTGDLDVDNINIDGNAITSTDTNGDITLSPDGTGTVVIDTDLDVDNININGNAITSTDTNGNIALTPNGTGEVDISKVDIDGGAIDAVTLGTNSAVTEAQIDNINVNGNAITSTDTNGNISLTPNGTGSVVIDGLSHPQADGSAGQFLKTDGSGQLSFDTVTADLSNDTTPQLGGDLDLNSSDITGTGNINNTGTVTTDGLTVAGNTDISGGTIKLNGDFPIGVENTAFGLNALSSASASPNDPTGNVAIGHDALTTNINLDHNTAVGFRALANHGGTDPAGTGENVAVGARALEGQTNGYRNTAVGFEAAYSNAGGHENVAIGYQTLYSADFNGDDNTSVGAGSGFNVTTGDKNSLFGFSAGSSITTGSKNTIIGSYGGNSGGLDIRTSDNNVVLSDGDGNIRLHSENKGRTTICGSAFSFGTHTSEPSGLKLHYETDTGIAVVGSFNKDSGQNSGDSELLFYTNSGAADSTEKMRIDTSGNLLVADTTNVGTADHKVSIQKGSAGRCLGLGTTVTTASVMMSLVNGNGTVGTIQTNGTATSYNTSSDHRLKENVADMTGAIDRVKALAPKRFNFIADADRTVDGFLAHETQTVVPEAVTGTHNEVDDDGNAVMQGIDQSKLVPLLTGALQEAIAKIETLETKVAALEAGN